MDRNFISSIFAAAFLAIATSTFAAIPPAENLLPSDTLLVVTAPDCAAFRAAMHQSPQWLLWNDPAMKPFHDNFIAKWRESFVAPLERDLGVKLADFADLPQGQITFAVTQNGWDGTDDGKPPGILLLLDTKGKSDLLKTNLAALQQKWSDAGRPVQTETVRGITFSIVTLASNDMPASLASLIPQSQPVQELGKKTEPVKPGQIVFGQFESLLIVGNSIEAVAPVAAHLAGGAIPMLSDNAGFAADQLSQFRGSPLYYGWFNAKAVFTVLSHVPPPQPNPYAPNPMPQIPWDKVLAASGTMGLKSTSFTYRESHEGSQVNVFLSAPESGRTGIFSILAAAPKSSGPPSFVPADAVKFWRWRVDGQKSWAGLQTMLADISPAALNSLNSVIGVYNSTARRKDPDFDFTKNFIGNLGDDFISYQKMPEGKARANLNNVPSLFLFAAPNPEQALLAVNSLTSMGVAGRPQPKPRDFLGKKIYSSPLPSNSMAGATARFLYCAASDGYVALTADSAILENFLRNVSNPGRPLSATPGLIDAAQRVGDAGGGLFGYQNQHETMRSTFEGLKNIPANSVAKAMRSESGLFDLLYKSANFSLLPDYDEVSKYFYFSVYGGRATVDGLSLKFFAPRPPGLN
ncbi:MAG TPA: hypothetical protein VIK35_04605 [Verrucomicrobiae bacterium]